ncbi:MAG: glycosyltransferase family 2 protein [Coxiellaceae bacterium]|nr:glycosyltransferase family 2 protein [Coxiellaceae bacterium]
MSTLTNPQRQQAIKQRQLFISCVVPMHNESELIVKFCTELEQTLRELTDHYDIILIDDGSTDDSVALAKQHINNHPNVKLITLSRNFGKEMAIAAGLEHASGDVTVIIDADFQHPLEYIARFVEHWGEGYDNVYGVRKNRKDEGFYKRHSTNLFYRILDKMTEVPIPRNAGDFRLLDKQVVASLNQCQERARFTKGLYAWVGYRSIGIPFTVQARAGGKSSWKYGRLTNLAITGLTAFSDIPLRIWGMIGGVISLFSLASVIYIIVDTLVTGIDVPGYATLLVVLIFFGGIQLLSIGILGEYVSRIFNEVKKRPPYIIHQKIGLDNDNDQASDSNA